VLQAQAEAESRLRHYEALYQDVMNEDDHTGDRPYWLLTISAGQHTTRAAMSRADEALAVLDQLDQPQRLHPKQGEQMNTSTIEPTAGAQRLSRPRSAVAAAVGIAGLAGFELALALGAPLGRAATGGTHTYLPAGLRIASGLLTIFWALGRAVDPPSRRVPGPRLLSPGGPRRNLGAWRPAHPRRADEPGIIQRLGTLPAGPHRSRHGGTALPCGTIRSHTIGHAPLR
jgi:hypothetical protein